MRWVLGLVSFRVRQRENSLARTINYLLKTELANRAGFAGGSEP
jgi:hypothetical protein